MFSDLWDKVTTFPFIHRVWEMVERKDTDDLISWSSGGKTFVIKNEYEFATKLLPSYFKHSNLPSFHRNLNIYGFNKISVIQAGLNNENTNIEFANPNFMRGHPDLLKNITRKTNNTKIIRHTIRNSENEHMQSELERIFIDVKQIKVKLGNICNVIEVVKKDNEKLKKEVATLRSMHRKQQHIVNYLIRFQMALVEPIDQPDDPKMNDARLIGPYGPMCGEYAPMIITAKLNSSTDYVHSQIRTMLSDEDLAAVEDLTKYDLDEHSTAQPGLAEDDIDTLDEVNMSCYENITIGESFIKGPTHVYRAKQAKQHVSSPSTTEDANIQMAPPAQNSSKINISVVPGAHTIMISSLEDAVHNKANVQMNKDSFWHSNDANFRSISTELKGLDEETIRIEKIEIDYEDQSVTLNSQEIKNEPQDNIEDFNDENVSQAMREVSDEVDPMQTDLGPLNELIYNNGTCSNHNHNLLQVKTEIDVSPTEIEQRSTCDSTLTGVITSRPSARESFVYQNADSDDSFVSLRIEDDSDAGVDHDDDDDETSDLHLFTPERMSPMEECSQNDWAIKKVDDVITAVINKPALWKTNEHEAERADGGKHEEEAGIHKRELGEHEGESERYEWESERHECEDTGTHEGESGRHGAESARHEEESGRHEAESARRDWESGRHEGESERYEEDLGADKRESPETAHEGISYTNTPIMESMQLSPDTDRNISKLIDTNEKLSDSDLCNDMSNRSLVSLKHKLTDFSLEIHGKQLRKTTGLARYTSPHTDERRFACDECDKRFKAAGNLLKHKEKHLIDRVPTTESPL